MISQDRLRTHSAAWRRIPAFVTDCGVIAVFTIILSIALHSAGMGFDGLSLRQTHLTVFMMVTVPVIVIFTLCEAALGVTPGKAVWGLEVDPGRSPASIAALVRNVIKFLPWEIAHAGIWIMPGRPFIDPPEPLSLFLWSAAILFQAGQAGLILLTGRGLHDRLSGATVRAAEPSEATS